jgi:1,2-diacylglycerol 3-alpha-glucosyltransferase
MKIALFSESYKPNFNGVINIVSKIKEYMEKKGHKAYLFTCGKITKEKNVYSSPKITVQQGYGPSIPYYNQREILDKVDLVHTHHPFTLGLFGLRIARKNNIPIVATSHVKYDNAVIYTLKFGRVIGMVVREYVGWFFRKCDAIILPSKLYRDEFIKKYKVPSKKIKVIPSFIDKPPKINKRTTKILRNKYKLDTKKVLIYTGRLSPEKNLHFLINSFNEVCRKKEDVILFILGGGPSLSSLKKLVNRYHLKDKVIFTGEISNKKVFEYLSVSDIFVSASKTETSSLSLLEANSMKNTSVTSKITGFCDITKDQKTGLLVEGEDKKDFANAILDLLSDEIKLNKMKNEAYKESTNYYTEKIMKMTLNLYSDLIQKNKKESGVPKNAKEINIKSKSNKEFFLLHCYTGSTTDFHTLPQYLHKRFDANVKIIRLKGHGESIKSLDNFTYLDFYKQAEKELQKELKAGKKVVLIGLSLGAQLALDLSSRHKVNGVILVSMPYRFIFPFNIDWFIPLFSNLIFFKKYIKKRLSKEEENLRKEAFYYSHMHKNGLNIILNAKNRLKKSIANVKAPVLSIYSKKDVIGHYKGKKILENELKSEIKQSITLESRTHNLFYCPDYKVINKGIGDFIENYGIFKTKNQVNQRGLKMLMEEWVN